MQSPSCPLPFLVPLPRPDLCECLAGEEAMFSSGGLPMAPEAFGGSKSKCRFARPMSMTGKVRLYNSQATGIWGGRRCSSGNATQRTKHTTRKVEPSTCKAFHILTPTQHDGRPFSFREKQLRSAITIIDWDMFQWHDLTMSQQRFAHSSTHKLSKLVNRTSKAAPLADRQ